VLLSLDDAHRVHIAEAIPVTPDLAPGTQLALALAAVSARYTTSHSTSAAMHFASVAAVVQALEIGLFDLGGVVVDGGCGERNPRGANRPPTTVPDEWRILLVLDRKRIGVHGEEESATFARLPAFAAKGRCRTSAGLC
jgi:predicted sugar kinase